MPQLYEMQVFCAQVIYPTNADNMPIIIVELPIAN